MSGSGVTHHERGCQHQVVPLITGLLLSRLGVPVLSFITRCIYSGYAPLDFLLMHSVGSNQVCSQMSSILFPCKVVITVWMVFSQAELGVVRRSFKAGICWISVGFLKKESERRPVCVNATSSINTLRHQKHKGIRRRCFITDIPLS